MEEQNILRNQTIMAILGVLIFTITFIGITYACYSTNMATKTTVILSK